jgi:hypothetical protein
MSQKTGLLFQGVSDRSSGSLRLPQDEASRMELTENRRRFFAAQGVALDRVVSAALVHGIKISVVKTTDAGAVIPETDALVTDAPDLILTVTVADCLPVFFFDPEHHAVGIAHAGWRGVVDGIVPNVIATMRAAFGTDPARLLASTGPAIQVCHFEIQDDILGRFAEFPAAIIRRERRIFVDLPAMVRSQLATLGVPDGQIRIDKTCTYDHPENYFSRRRDREGELKAMVAYIGWRTPT